MLRQEIDEMEEPVEETGVSRDAVIGNCKSPYNSSCLNICGRRIWVNRVLPKGSELKIQKLSWISTGEIWG